MAGRRWSPGDPDLRHLVTSITVLGVVKSRRAGRPYALGLRYHGDRAAEPGVLDSPSIFVVIGLRTGWCERLSARLTDLARYPSWDDERAAVGAVALRHGLPESHVLLLAGGAGVSRLLPAFATRLAALIGPSFTEPDAVSGGGGYRSPGVTLEPPFHLISAAVPDGADLVVVGNPTNPTEVLILRRDAGAATAGPDCPGR